MTNDIGDAYISVGEGDVWGNDNDLPVFVHEEG
jgi:hypothetical protein